MFFQVSEYKVIRNKYKTCLKPYTTGVLLDSTKKMGNPVFIPDICIVTYYKNDLVEKYV